MLKLKKGIKMDIKDIIKNSKIKETLLILPNIEIERNEYLNLKKTLERLGGK